MKNCLFWCILFLIGPYVVFCQDGYVKLNSDSLIEGCVRYKISPQTGKRVVELWRTKRDRHPLRFHENELYEYSTGAETVRVTSDSGVPANKNKTERSPSMNIGIGAGLGYGGLGARFSLLPVKNIALFGAVGYNLLTPGLNAGVTVKKSITETIAVSAVAM